MNAWCQFCYDTTPVRAANCEEPCQDYRNYVAVTTEADVAKIAAQSAQVIRDRNSLEEVD